MRWIYHHHGTKGYMFRRHTEARINFVDKKPGNILSWQKLVLKKLTTREFGFMPALQACSDMFFFLTASSFSFPPFSPYPNHCIL